MHNVEVKGDADLNHVRVLAAINGIELFGHERGNIEVFKALRESGAEVVIGVSNRTHDGVNQVEKTLHELGFETFQLPFGPQWSIQWVKKDPRIALTNLSAVVKCSRIFYRKLRDFEPTHIHLGSPLAYSYLSLALALTKTPMVYRMGDAPPVDSRFNYRVWWKRAMARTTVLVANSKYIVDTAVTAGVDSERVCVIYNHPPSRKERDGISMSLLGEEEFAQKKLLYVGSISEHKGLVPLVDALALLRDKGVKVRLHLAGGSRWDSEFQSRLKKRIRDRMLEDWVVWHGFIEDPEPLYAMADLHVAPSLWQEPSGNIVVEAKRAGRASVVFASGGLPEYIRHRVDGYICEEKTAASLASALQWMLEDRARLEKMGWEARLDYETRLGWERFKKEWADVYASLPG